MFADEVTLLPDSEKDMKDLLMTQEEWAEKA